MCDKKILTPWPGHSEICDGVSHCYIENMESKYFPGIFHTAQVYPKDFGENIEGVFFAPCPSPKQTTYEDYLKSRPFWEKEADREAKQLRNEIDETVFSIDRSKTFESFDMNFNDQAGDVQEIMTFLLDPKEKRLILKGDVGRGKTHLAQACNNFAQQNGVRSEIISSRRLYLLYRELEGFDCDWIYEKAMKRIWAAKIFIVDDLGNEKQTDNQVFNQNFIELLDEFEGKIIITTNLSEKDMENIYGTKIVSRLYDNAVIIVLKGCDYRRAK